MSRSDVLIIGAGPTGLVLALWLVQQGVTVRIIDKTGESGTTSRALAVQARTLELYRQLDLTDAVLQQGHMVPGVNLWVQGKKKTRVSFETIAEGLTPYGPLIFPQDLHERLLITRLEELGVSVERNMELLGFDETGNHIAATLRGSNGLEETCEANYLAGCDGARSIVRQIIGTGFPGGTYHQVFYVADVDAAGPSVDGELHVDLDEADFLAVFPMKGEGRVRLIGTVRDERAERAEDLTFKDVSDRAIEHMRIEVRKLNWFSTYRVHHRVTEHFRKGRAFLLGDAAHIHSPAGGQGMNTGIGDAINLAWKLKAVLAGLGPDTILDTYETERRAFAQKLVATTDKGFTLATAEGRVANFIRTCIIPIVVPAMFRFEAARRYMYRAVSQISVSYRDSAMSKGEVGHVRGGDRLPWAPVAGADNFDTFRIIGWQLHVYGTCSPDLSNWCKQHNLRLSAFTWNATYERSGFSRNAIYLVRPDTYIALASDRQDPEILRSYFADRDLSLGSSIR
jgi:2-polyprenyl-6-methoxyphenol hydroxylase-like FAD-dependent oxidoreductase